MVCSKLERKRTINSMSLAQERLILKEIASVQKGKVKVEEYNTVDKQIQEIKVRKPDPSCA